MCTNLTRSNASWVPVARDESMPQIHCWSGVLGSRVLLAETTAAELQI